MGAAEFSLGAAPSGAFPVRAAGSWLGGVLKVESPGRWLVLELPSRLGERERERRDFRFFRLLAIAIRLATLGVRVSQFRGALQGGVLELWCAFLDFVKCTGSKIRSCLPGGCRLW